MRALRYVYLLALTVWLGGMVVLGAIVAPVAFQVLPAADPAGGRALAGAFFRETLVRFHTIAYAAGGALLLSLAGMALLGPRPRRFAVRVAVAALMLAVALGSGLYVLGSIDRLQAEIGHLPSLLPDGDPRRAAFDALHQWSARLMLVNMIGGLVLLYLEAESLNE